MSEINYIADSDIAILDKYNETEHNLKYADVLDAFNDNLSENPNNTLVSYNDTSFTYAESAFLADKLADRLKNAGVSAQDNVAFLVERSEKYMLSVLGILSIGAVYVPLDDKHPDERIEFILNDTAAGVVIVDDTTYERAKSINDDCVLINISEIINDGAETLNDLNVVYGDLACILYTSGTTGIPKGVKITRKSIINYVGYYVDNFNMSPEDVYTLFASIGFDVGAIKSIFVPMVSGACLDVIPEDIRLNISELNNHFINNGVTHAHLPTQVAKLFINDINNTSLDVLLTGGEKLGEVDFNGDYLFADSYGPTEACVSVSAIEEKDKIDSSSIGHLLYNLKAYVLDNELRGVPVGAVGELCISGNQLADGYLNRDEETVNAFIKNPFDDHENYDRIYRTGDMVRVLPDGSLAIVGRRDKQVKIRGNRVELGEIEAVIRELDCIEDVTVQAIENNTNKELVAYVVSSKEVDDLDEVIRSYVGDNKPDYMVPTFVIPLDEIPLNVNGKVDKRALPDVDSDSLHAEYVAPTTEMEKAIVKAFERAFNKEKISLYDNFISIGGDSIIAIKMVSLLAKENIKIDVRSLFKNRTPYKIARSVNEDSEYGFELVKKGKTDQNMFMIPHNAGLSFIFSHLIENIEFDGNIYVIDDYKYEFPLDEIRKSDGLKLAFEKYYDAIKDIFQDGDIIVGYSLGCVLVPLIVERLEKTKTVDKCILIDGTIDYEYDSRTESFVDDLSKIKDMDLNEFGYDNDNEFKNKIREVLFSNSKWKLDEPRIDSPVIYLATMEIFKEQLEKISSNHEFIFIDSNHKDIVGRDVGKIIKYFK